jgi:hypothetical protein
MFCAFNRRVRNTAKKINRKGKRRVRTEELDVLLERAPYLEVLGSQRRHFSQEETPQDTFSLLLSYYVFSTRKKKGTVSKTGAAKTHATNEAELARQQKNKNNGKKKIEPWPRTRNLSACRF